jgi:hypothetical protein
VSLRFKRNPQVSASKPYELLIGLSGPSCPPLNESPQELKDRDFHLRNQGSGHPGTSDLPPARYKRANKVQDRPQRLVIAIQRQDRRPAH